MAKRSAGERAAEFVGRARIAIKAGVSRADFLRQARAKDFAIRRQTMLDVWRSEANLKKVEGSMRFIRKGYYPSPKMLGEVTYKMSAEFMYKVKVWTQTRPGEPLESRFVNITSNVPLTGRMAETKVFEAWGGWERYQGETLERAQAWTAITKVKQ